MVDELVWYCFVWGKIGFGGFCVYCSSLDYLFFFFELIFVGFGWYNNCDYGGYYFFYFIGR